MFVFSANGRAYLLVANFRIEVGGRVSSLSLSNREKQPFRNPGGDWHHDG